MRALLTVAALGTASAHGGLTFPVPRNNYHNVDPRNWTSDGTSGGRYHSGGPCAGGECLWFSQPVSIHSGQVMYACREMKAGSSSTSLSLQPLAARRPRSLPVARVSVTG